MIKNIEKYFLSFSVFLLLVFGVSVNSVSAQTSDENSDDNIEIYHVEETENNESTENLAPEEEVGLQEDSTVESEENESVEEVVEEDTTEAEETTEQKETVETEEQTSSEDSEIINESEESDIDAEEDEKTVPELNEVQVEVEQSNESLEKAEPKSAFHLQGIAVDSTIQELNNHSDVKIVAYHGTISANNGNIYNQPNNLSGSVQLGQVTSYNNQEVIVRREGTFANRNWILVEKDGAYIGWMLKDKVVSNYEEVTSDRTVAYNSLLNTNGRYQIFNRPAYTEGNYQVFDSSDFTGESVIVRNEINTDNNESRMWTLIELNGQLLGWINSQALTPVYNNITNEKTVAYDGTVNTNGRYQIFSRPAYTNGNYQVANSSDYYGKDIIVRGEIDTDYYGGTTWSLIESNGKQIGWINSNAVSPDYDTITDEKTLAYEGTLNSNGRYQIFSRPAYTEGNYQVANSSDYYGDSIVVRGQTQTKDNRTWVLLEANGKELGWINSNAISENYDDVLSSRAVNRPKVVRNLKGRYQLFSSPAYTKGSYQVGNILDYAGQAGMITQERVTNRAVWHLLSINGQTLGWINDLGLRRPRVYVDVGHGGHDSGAYHGGVKEKDLNLPTALYLKNELEASGNYTVIMSREKDVFLELSEISNKANRNNPDIFVSIHYNSMGGSGAARGIETFIHHRVSSGFGQETNHNNFRTDDPRIKKSLDLANAIHGNLIKDTGLYDRGVKGNNFHVVRETNMPAVLLELGFIDNATERNIVANSSYQRKAAKAILKGINGYFIH